ncbi:MAG TPA: TPM domain-containing protein [Chthoniobacterales bacterium]
MRTKEFIEKLEHERIVKAIAGAEATTSGEIRVFVQHGEVADPVDAARVQFERLGMTQTRERNAVLIFVAPRAQKFAVIGDRGVHEKCGDPFWHTLTQAMRTHFQAQNFTDAVVHAVRETGRLLAQYFPRRPDDRNELPNAVLES